MQSCHRAIVNRKCKSCGFDEMERTRSFCAFTLSRTPWLFRRSLGTGRGAQLAIGCIDGMGEVTWRVQAALGDGQNSKSGWS